MRGIKEFFSSTRFKVILCILVVLLALIIRAAYAGEAAALGSQILSACAKPFRQLSAAISDNVGGFFDTLLHAQDLAEENEALREQLRQLNEQMADYDELRHQNELYKNFLEIKDKNDDFTFEPASVIGRDSGARFDQFIIDRGSLDGIEYRDPVITADGLIGVITEVGLTSSKVTTVLDVGLDIAVYDTRTRDTGILAGDVELAAQGYCRLGYIPRESGIAAGDLLVTSGVSGIFPEGQLVGRVVEVFPEASGSSLYAVVQPLADVHGAKDVLVITSFEGQGSAQLGG